MANEVALNIYQTKSDRIALDKTLEQKIELTGTFREPTNVIDPVIEIQANPSTIAVRNYFDIPAFNRSYFITDIVASGYGRVIIKGHVDVLSTYADQIRQLKAVIARQENRYNLYIDDNLFKIDSRTIIQTKEFTGGGTFAANPGICLVLVG